MDSKITTQSLGSSVVEMFAPVIRLAVGQAVKIAFVEFANKSKEYAKLTAIELYPIVDTVLENLTDKTETKVDDATIDGIKDAIEAYAKDAGFELQNLDED